METVDIVVLSRDESPLNVEVERGLHSQKGVRVQLHRVTGRPLPSDTRRWETIVRARNRGKRLGTSRWLMFVDDDIVLKPDCVKTLLDALKDRPAFGALAADALGQSTGHSGTNHVGVGATLFRRSALDKIRFRWEEGRCECSCCCEDLRKQRIGIAYLTGLTAKHLKLQHAVECSPTDGNTSEGQVDSPTTSPKVFTAFNRRDVVKFRDQFLLSLRKHGNNEDVVAFTYGLYASHRRILDSQTNVNVRLHDDSAKPAKARVDDFCDALSNLAPDTPVAYWDAGDVIFANRISALWDLVRAHPDKLLVALECVTWSRSHAWLSKIRDPKVRADTQRLLAGKRIINAGFAAGTARTLRKALQETRRHNDRLVGTASNDQLALNVHCYRNRSAWQAISDGWNYCLYGRTLRSIRVQSIPSTSSTDAIRVLHGNGKTLSSFVNQTDTLRICNALSRPIRSLQSPAYRL